MSYEAVHHNGAVDFERNRISGLLGSFQQAEFSVVYSLNLLNVVQNIIFTIGVLLMTFLSAY